MPLEAYKVDPECNAGGNIYYGQHGPASSSAPEVRATELVIPSLSSASIITPHTHTNNSIPSIPSSPREPLNSPWNTRTSCRPCTNTLVPRTWGRPKDLSSSEVFNTILQK
ncbi:Hypothetical protein FKW44_004069 [Caligus rogercresseyi]|uniref:Uncharacterized protein n=1 Tax=Caligus rogercresseyi TaxID=217165 RepID=A0A7T8KAZ4_CALRO|nr:Hypothetical protein FKW44_004069 [Caligus rogercresseyi]